MEPSPTGWTQPTDLDFSRLSFAVGGNAPGEIGSNHVGGAQTALCDGSVRFVSKQTPPQVLRAMATKAGAESVSLP